jgi:hypothetical protein
MARLEVWRGLTGSRSRLGPSGHERQLCRGRPPLVMPDRPPTPGANHAVVRR